MAVMSSQKQVKIRLDSALYRALETLARQKRLSIPRAARLLVEEGLQYRFGGQLLNDDTPGSEIAKMALTGGAFDWLADEPDLYDDTCGEPL
ncbi:MAG TPA: hypothetical protein VKU00_02100 [Chthonomonadaceae bacterium]|nr:hypothetical protein [Chthonomonadaceae bacterium]